MDTPWASLALHGLATTIFLSTYAWFTLGILLLCLHLTTPHLTLRLASALGSAKVGISLAAVLTGIYLAVMFVTMSFPGYVDPCEPLVVAASYFATHGTPVYDTVIAYGPYCFLPYSLVMHIFGNSITTLRVMIVGGNFLLVALLFVVFYSRLVLSKAFLAVALLLGFFLLDQNYILQIRGDLFIYLAVALALVSVNAKGQIGSVLLMALAVSGTAGVKVTAVLYLIYPLFLFLRRHGINKVFIVVGLAMILSLAPFINPNLSLWNYLQWLDRMAREPRSDKEFLGNLIVTMVLFSPVFLIFWTFARCKWNDAMLYLRSEAVMIAALLVSVFAMVILSAKFGAGRHHLTPFAIVTAYLAVDIYKIMQNSSGERTVPSLMIAYFWACLGILLVFAEAGELQQVYVTTRGELSQATALTNDVNNILDRHPHVRIELGSGQGAFNMDHHYSEIYAAPQLIFSGNPYTFDLAAEADRELMNIPLAQSKFRYITGCNATIWLIPSGQTPFSTKSIYSGMYPMSYPSHYLFPRQFEQAFTDAYIKTESSKFFDIFTCRSRPS